MQNPTAGEYLDQDAVLRRLDEISWDFEGERSRSLFSGVHFHPGRFISQLPSVVISLLSQPGDTVLDPYCGSGTTLVEAQRLGRRGIGIDINPVSTLLTKAKTLPLSYNVVSNTLNKFFLTITKPTSSTLLPIPDTVQAEKWYSPGVLENLRILFTDLSGTADENEKLLKMLCFSAVLQNVCRETRHWGYICDNTTPRGNPMRSVAVELAKLIEKTSESFRQRDAMVPTGVLPTVVFDEKAERVSDLIERESVDLIVTSPPYFGVVDYVKAQRLSYEWFGFDLEGQRQQETGARSKRHRRNAPDQFITELHRSLTGMYEVLKEGRYCVVVFGASNTRGLKLEQLNAAAIDAGFLSLRQADRQISIQRNLKPSLLSERIFVLRK